MQLISGNKLSLKALKDSIGKPEIFSKGTDKFWDDRYISKQMLKLHLDPEVESASRTKETIEAETKFIVKMTSMGGKKVLDLGCGPGLYVREFAKTGAMITGIDFSDTSISYANENISRIYTNASFLKMNYLDINFKEAFDVMTLIFYDFCALNPEEQNKLLTKIHAALVENGVFVFDVVSEEKKVSPSTAISICEGNGFWSADPYVEILRTFLYEDPKTEGLQYTIISENGAVKVIRIYHRLFGLEELVKLLQANNFVVDAVYKNLRGDRLTENSETYAVFARKA